MNQAKPVRPPAWRGLSSTMFKQGGPASQGMRIIVLTLVALLAAPLAYAGDASSPEITDATGDATFSATGANACPGGDCQGPAAVADIIQGWVVETETMLTFVVQIVSAEANKVYGPQEHQVFFTYQGTEYDAGIRLGTSSTAGGDDAVDPMGIATAARIGSDQYEWDVLREALGSPGAGDKLEGMYMTSYQQGQTAGDTEDRAPDSDGVTFSFALGGGDESPVVYSDHDGTNLSLVATYTEPTDRVEVNNWTFDGHDVDFRLDFNGTGTIAVQVLDGAGDEVLNGSFESGLHEEAISNGTEGTWVVNVTLSGVNGTYSLLLEPHGAQSGDQGDGSTTGDGTTDDDMTGDADDPDGGPEGNATAEDEDTPWLAAPLAVFVLVALAARRRASP